jgi:hypothetical protein
MLWRRIAVFASFVFALMLVAWMRSEDFGWLASLGAGAVAWVIISQLCAAFILWRAHHSLK